MLPHSAASIITPMMLLALTIMSSFTSSICEWKLLASRTSCAVGRACKPRELTTFTLRSITRAPSARE